MHFAEGSLMNWLVMKLVFMTICVTRGAMACSTSPKMPRRVATRTGLKMQACAIMSAASSGASVNFFGNPARLDRETRP